MCGELGPPSINGDGEDLGGRLIIECRGGEGGEGI